jgi:hypothetical protein
MTLIEFLFAVVSVANTVLLSLVLVELREARMTRDLRESKRRAWIKMEHKK